MGAAFLLLETKSVVQFALLFGTMGVVNSLVFAWILVSVLRHRGRVEMDAETTRDAAAALLASSSSLGS